MKRRRSAAAAARYSYGHFFQPLICDFLDHLMIPKTFMVNHLGGIDEEECKVGILISNSGRRWPVKLRGRRIIEGWPEFAVEHGLSFGDFVVFAHLGNLVFEVEVYKPSGCAEMYPLVDPLLSEKDVNLATVTKATSVVSPANVEDLNVDDVAEDDPVLLSGEDDRIVLDDDDDDDDDENVHSEEDVNVEMLRKETFDVRPANVEDLNDIKKQQVINQTRSRAASLPQLKHPNFVARVGCEMSRLNIPVQFLRENELGESPRNITLRNQKGRSWPAKIYHTPAGRGFVRSGWREFRVGNGLKDVDSVIFELVKDGPELVANIYVNMHNPKKSQLQSPILKRSTTSSKAAAPSSTCQPSSFFTTVTQHSIMKSQLNIPMKFARAEGLCNKKCQVILQNQNKSSWNVTLRHVKSAPTVYLGSGYRKFAEDNGLKVGESITFELIKGRPQLVMEFRRTMETLL